MEYELSCDGDVLRVRTSGRASVSGLGSLLKDSIGHPEWRSDMDVLVDHRQSQFGDLSSEDIRGMSRRARSLGAALGTGRMALVFSEALGFGLARMWEILTQDHVSLRIRVFASMDQAEQWIAEGR